MMNVNERMRIRCKFSTNPKLNLTIKRSEKHPKGYSIKPKTLGEKIRKHRMDLGLFQKDVAKFVGVKTDTVTLWEKDKTKPSKENLRKIKLFLATKK
ncbi:helix-turn-helix transcriptional regulator [candidate division WOR-3 bacterium]|nr:helix-turn-helix transcriptional regulator [candidate division WOR-3 bacterium]